MKGSSNGLFMNIILGIVGGVVGGWAMDFVGCKCVCSKANGIDVVDAITVSKVASRQLNLRTFEKAHEKMFIAETSLERGEVTTYSINL